MVINLDNIVGLGDISISSISGDIIKTFALASCVGITAYCASLHLAGMIHIVLPTRPKHSIVNSKPSYYASTGVPLFIKSLLENGCAKNELAIKIFGGAFSPNKNDYFNIGLRNLNEVENSLRLLNVPYMLVDVGGSNSRTLFMDVATGAIKVHKLPILI